MNLQKLNEIIEKHLKKNFILMTDESIPAPVPPALKALAPDESALEVIKIKESKILLLHNELTVLELNAKSELLRLDQSKQKIITTTLEKKSKLSKLMADLKTEVEEAKAEMARVRTEMEQRKKKIINLKDLPSDSTEKLPE